ncbi:cell wall-associated NlpC family hydrolase [Marmoricola sp. OAE513]|uniref:C40 family peptidase n=1 Tax=Marmoricola sp. OAE513 TaxID=2817894 RepID=UPI001AE152E8
MRRSVRAVLACSVAAATVVGFSAVADADRKPVPTKAQVDAAKAAAARKAGDVSAIRAELVVARTKLEAAAARAEQAAEAYNGARWRLQEATTASQKATAAANEASKKVADQKAGIAALATQSFQSGADLAGITAYLSPGGPEEIADRISITQSVGATLQDQFDAYAAADTLARTTRARADEAKRDQEALTAKAASARDRAAASANAAQAAASAIAEQRRRLITELAKAQKISVALATQRQNGLEQIAQEKAARAAAAKARAEAAAAAAAAAKNDKNDGKNDSGKGGGKDGSSDDEPADPPPVSTSGAAAKAIAFARQQLGERYQWAAAGPDAWDCSGLTMMAWRAAGVALPHFSAAQYDATRHIGVNDLRPGDLVFWGDSPGSIHHVALYLGNGQILHAPRTGRPVAIDSMYYWVPPNYFGRP